MADSRERMPGGERARRLRVVMLLPTYLPESFGGGEQQCRKLAHALARLGVRVTILAPRLLAATPASEWDGDIEIRRFRLRKPPNLGGRYAGSLLLWSLDVIAWLWARRAVVDLVHVFHGRLHALPGVVGGALIGRPSLVKIGRGSEHFDLSLVRGKRLIGPWAYRLLLKHGSGYIANSREIVEDLLSHRVPRERIFTVPNGVEIPDLEPVEDGEPGDRARPDRYVFLGRLEPEKRVDLMLEGFARFSDRTARLTIVGDGECLPRLRDLAGALGLGDRVAFPGRTDDVSQYLRAARYYLSTSSSEGMSNALLEAMSFGVVPLVSAVSGAGDIVEHGRTGFLFRPDDLEDFVAELEVMHQATRSDYQRLSEAIRASISLRFGIDMVAEAHLRLYRHAVNQRPPSQPRETAPITAAAAAPRSAEQIK